MLLSDEVGGLVTSSEIHLDLHSEVLLVLLIFLRYFHIASKIT